MFCNTFFETGSTKFHERIERPNLNWLRWPKSMSVRVHTIRQEDAFLDQSICLQAPSLNCGN